MKTILLAVAVLTAAPSSGGADERSEAQQHYLNGKKAYELGAYDEAVAEYAAAYRLKDDPALLYDLGQAHRLADHPLEALRAYRMFLIRVPEAPNRADVERRIADLERRIAAAKRPEPATPAPVTPPPVTASPAPAVRAGVDRKAGRGDTIAGGVLVAAGGALVVGGVVCGVLAKQSSDRLTKLDQTMQPYDSSLERTGRTEQILEGVFLGVGAAAAIVGGALLVVGHRERARKLAFVPSAGPGVVAATLRGSF